MNTEQIRTILVKILNQWQLGYLNARDVHEEAEELVELCDWSESPKPPLQLRVIEVVSQLDILNHQLVIKEDIPVILKFLEDDCEQEEDAMLQWDNYWNGIDYEERKRQLKGHPYYIV